MSNDTVTILISTAAILMSIGSMVLTVLADQRLTTIRDSQQIANRRNKPR